MNIPEGWPTGAMCTAFEKETETSISMDCFDRGLRAALAAAPTPPTPEVEPVAWLSDSGNFYTKDSEYDLRAFTPLYTHPANDGLRKAAEELIEYLDTSKVVDANWITVNRLHESLRAALEKK